MKSKLFLFPLLLLVGCLSAQSTTVNYSSNSAAIPNPERGFYQHTETHSGAYDPLSAASLSALRNGYTSSGANYTTPVTLILRVFYLEDFINADISSTYLSLMQADFDAARTAGVKMVLRFAYTQDDSAPYNDAPKSRVISHITQLAPLLNDNEDVIAAVQQGFIGAWGEGYYTDYFGDPSQPPHQITASNWADRTEVLNALLAAVPASRQVQVRVPQYKQKAEYGPTAPVTSAPSGGRIGHHNDCFLATYADAGTYTNYDIPVDDTTHLKPYKANDSALNLAVGGETCELNGSWHLCQSGGGKADYELKRFHYSYLNADWYHPVNNSWTPCFSNINKRLGYRFVLQNGTYPNAATGGGTLNLSLNLQNEGYAKPYNARPLEFILRNTSTQTRYYATAGANPQNWALNSTEIINETFCLPSGIPAGNYEILLNLPDPIPTLYANPNYSIQLANTGLWESATGYNKLNHNIAVSGTGGGCSGHPVFALSSGVVPVELIGFYGENEKSGIRLHWTTESEQNSSHFEIERSSDALEFVNIGRVQAKGKSAVYSFLDTNPPGGTRLFYRLKTVDVDGKSKLGKMIAMELFHPSALQILQNPSGDLLRFRIEGPGIASSSTYKIISTDGRVLVQGESSGEIFIGNLPTGCYCLWISADGSLMSAKFLKG